MNAHARGTALQTFLSEPRAPNHSCGMCAHLRPWQAVASARPPLHATLSSRRRRLNTKSMWLFAA